MHTEYWSFNLKGRYHFGENIKKVLECKQIGVQKCAIGSYGSEQGP
jgi:hypothetical protein